jgi:DNA ligase-1
MDSIGKAIASEIPKAIITEDTMERVVMTFESASGFSGRLDKIGEMQRLILSPEDRNFVLTALYGSLKLGITVPIPNPVFGDTFHPQLCGTDKEIDPTKYVIEEKFDGIRCIGMNVDGNPKLYTRNGKPIVSEAIAKEITDATPAGYVLDGELVALDGDFQSMKRHSDEIVYQVFDMPFFDHNSITGVNLNGRRDILQEVLQEQEHIKISPLLNLKTMRDIDQWIERNGAEGVVAKDPNSFYSYGGRKDWIKIKPFLDISGWVQGYTPGTGKREGILGAVEFLPDGFDNTTLVGSGFNDENLLLMKSWLKSGKKVRITVKYQNLTNDNRLRFPTFLRFDEVI